ncbi:acyl-CoA thioesterase [Gracilimonas sp. Q87]|uniref:acyl-CoA thioesterase n=1 Tax=Gracilimonas sp. Q87 TaxID=3384766 RepID=UPI003983E69F
MFRPKYDKSLFYHWKEIPVRFRDLDPLNHVNNALFNTYLEEARISFLGKVGKMQSEFTDGKTFVLVKSTIEYLDQIKYPSSVLVGTGIGKIGSSSITAIQAIYNRNSKDLLCVAETKGVWFDISDQRPTRLPEIEDIEDMIVEGAFE